MNKRNNLILISCFMISMAIHGQTNLQFFLASLDANIYVAGLDWNFISPQALTLFFDKLLERATDAHIDLPVLNQSNPTIFFEKLRKIYQTTEALYPEPSIEWLSKHLQLNLYISDNISRIINIISANPRYAQFFLHTPVELLPEMPAQRHPLIIFFALLAGADPNKMYEEKMTLIETIKNYQSEQDEEIVGFLLLAGANPNTQDERTGNTPLHYAAYIKNQTIIHLLLEKYANPYTHNKQHQTPIDILTISRHFPRTSLRSAPAIIKNYFKHRPIDDFKEYCQNIIENLMIGQIVYACSEKQKMILSQRSLYPLNFLYMK